MEILLICISILTAGAALLSALTLRRCAQVSRRMDRLQRLCTDIRLDTEIVMGMTLPKEEPCFVKHSSDEAEDSRSLAEQRRWDEGISNLLSYAGNLKGGER